MIFILWEDEHVMKASRFKKEQVAFAVKQSELGTKVEEICHKMGISDTTFHKKSLSIVHLRNVATAINRSLHGPGQPFGFEFDGARRFDKLGRGP